MCEFVNTALMPPMHPQIWSRQTFSCPDGARWLPMAADYVEWSKLIGNLLGENLITCMECFLIFMLTSCLFQYCVRLFFGCNRLAGIWLSGIDEETCESMLEVWMKMHSLHIGVPGRHIQMHWGQIDSCKEPRWHKVREAVKGLHRRPQTIYVFFAKLHLSRFTHFPGIILRSSDSTSGT